MRKERFKEFNSMQYPPGYDEFEAKVRQFSVLDVLEKVIPMIASSLNRFH
ncbi:hypothetical protein GCM10011571_06980 [Marinithermofilum abyssi]|uniref:Uncharacterized protein n=1 Tax=Marinithermofilum abyssi TaxID=1571185 RepID=A0A8J2VHJ0_9BACL|nr:hypothetical protein GCM10011571_06980 [Marinithermofilum abyssi]